eukprot:5819899-Pleurochrysis_carterae.AAC.3
MLVVLRRVTSPREAQELTLGWSLEKPALAAHFTVKEFHRTACQAIAMRMRLWRVVEASS